MNKYDIIFNSLQEKVQNGSLTKESADILNAISYEKFVVESADHAEEGIEELTLEATMNALDEMLSSFEEAGDPMDKEEIKAEETAKKVIQQQAHQKRQLVANQKTNAVPKTEMRNIVPPATTEEAHEEITEESVKEMRLRVYEAATAGHITEDEKNAYLEKLVL